MNQLSMFNEYTNDGGELVHQLETFDHFGKKTQLEMMGEIPYYINEFWTAAQRQGHSIHEISYRACFKSQLPEFFISRLTKHQELVCDPFMGRGTTPVQAALMGRGAIGNDINPLSVLLTKPRMAKIDIEDIKWVLSKIDWDNGDLSSEELLAFYHPNTLKKLESLKVWIAKERNNTNFPKNVVGWIQMVSLNRLSGHSSGFFSGRSMPPNQAVSVKSQMKINEKLGIKPPERDIPAIIIKKSKSLLRNGCVETENFSQLLTGAAWDMADVKDGSVALTVTSPPFLDIVQYAADNWLRCWFADIDPTSVAIDSHKTEKAWTEMVRAVLVEQQRILRSGGFVAFEVGEVRQGKILLEQLVWKAAEGLAFDRLGVMVNDQKFTKTANCWGVSNGSKGTNTNRIVLLQRH